MPRKKPSPAPDNQVTPAPRILVVEDDVHTAKAIALQVEAAGFAVVGTAATGDKAIALAKSDQPDLVLMDINLEGGMDGIEAAQAIRSSLGIPVLFLTAHTDRDYFERAKITEPFAYLIKPINERELVLTIEMALFRHKLEARLRESEKHLAEAQRIGHLGSWDWDLSSDIVLWSDEIFRIFGLPVQRQGISKDALLEQVHGEDRAALRKAIRDAINKNHRFSMYHRVLQPGGKERVVHHSGEVQLSKSGEAVRMTGTVQDVTEIKSAEAKLWHLAHHDPLCDLPNRMLMYDRLSQTLSRARRSKRQVALLLFDLDDFKRINDTYGHQAGDDLLVEIGQRLRHCVRDSDTIARLGGDEFTLIVDQLEEARDAALVAQKIIDAMQEPVSLDGQILQVTCSIGIAIYPADATSMDELLKAADHAMYESKHVGKNNFNFYADVKRHTH